MRCLWLDIHASHEGLRNTPHSVCTTRYHTHSILFSIVFSHLFLFPVTDFFNLSKWESVPKRSELQESTEPDTVLLSVSLCERSRSRSIRLTSVSFVERTLSRELALESGTADLAARPLLEVPTLFPLLLPSLSAVPLDV
jgi:hypothetical protein